VTDISKLYFTIYGSLSACTICHRTKLWKFADTAESRDSQPFSCSCHMFGPVTVTWSSTVLPSSLFVGYSTISWHCINFLTSEEKKWAMGRLWIIGRRRKVGSVTSLTLACAWRTEENHEYRSQVSRISGCFLMNALPLCQLCGFVFLYINISKVIYWAVCKLHDSSTARTCGLFGSC
jgi:hypothetical protein